MEGGLPVSPISTDFSGFGSPISISRQGNFDSHERTQTSLVSSSPPNVVQQVHATQSHSISDSELEHSLRSILRDVKSTRMDFLKLIYRKSSTPIVTDYLTTALRTSTYNQYESVWRKFKAYVIETDPVSIDLNFVMSFSGGEETIPPCGYLAKAANPEQLIQKYNKSEAQNHTIVSINQGSYQHKAHLLGS